MTDANEAAPADVRWAIRQYLRQIMTVLDEKAGDDWPYISAASYHRHRQTFRECHLALRNVAAATPGLAREAGRYADIFGQAALALMELDWGQPTWPSQFADSNSGAAVASPQSCGDQLPLPISGASAGRPPAVRQFDQLHCTPCSALRRARRILQEVDPTHCTLLCLGDDDLVSLAIAAGATGAQLHVVDVDPRLLQHIADRAPGVHCHEIDIAQQPMPSELLGACHAVTLDPYWHYEGAVTFLNAAQQCLRPEPDARIYLSLCPLFMGEQLARFQHHIHRLDLVIDEILPFFSWYDLSLLPEPTGQELVLSLFERSPSQPMQLAVNLPFGFSHLYVLSPSAARH